MSRVRVAALLLAAGGLLPLVDVALGWHWYVDGIWMVLIASIGGYAAGAWRPRSWAAAGVAAAVPALVAANQLHDQGYHWLDDLIFFLVVVGGPAVAGAAMTTRADQVRRLTRLQAELDELQRIEVAAARLDEQARVMAEVHSGLAEQIAAIGIRAEGARRAEDATALAAIETEARTVLDRLRDALGSLRTDDGTPPVAPTDTVTVRGLNAFDVLVPALIGVALAIETAVVDHAEGPIWANVLAALGVVSPLVVRRVHPILAVAGVGVLGIAMSAVLTPIPETVTGVALMVLIFYTVGAWCPRWWWLVGWAVATAGVLGMELISGQGGDSEGSDDAWIVLFWTVGAVAVGRITAGWQLRVQRTQAVVDELGRGRDAAVHLAVAREREALASELHDTVAHAMTVVCLQAGAHQRAGGTPHEALATIAAAAEKSLEELREGLEAMEAADDPLDRSRITALGRRLGVDLQVSAEHTGSGPAAVLAHRVIREAVVNVARHAPGASAAVRIERADDDMLVEVVDDGSQHEGTLDGTGTGLHGLAETLAAVGGALEWGPRQPRGFRVAARIPAAVPAGVPGEQR